MSANEFLNETATEVLKEARRQRRSRIVLTTALALIAALLAGMAVVVYVDAKADQARSDSISRIVADLKKFCEDGVIDCRGHKGLPGAKGGAGTGISRVSCQKGRFVVAFTDGRIQRVGDCVARDGARGPRGFRGRPGRNGKPGRPGPRGPRGFRGPRGYTGAPGHSVYIHTGGGGGGGGGHHGHGHGHGHR